MTGPIAPTQDASPPSPMGAARRGRKKQGTGFLYGWLLLALFLEYARPASFFPVLNIPFFYSAVPFLLFLVSLFAPGLRNAKEAFSDPQAKWIFGMLGLLFVSMVFFRSYAVGPFVQVLGYVMLFIVIVRLCDSWQRIIGVCTALIVAHLFLLAMNPIVLTDLSKRHYILGATFLGDGNDFGLSLCVLLPAAFWITRTTQSKLLRWFTYLAIVVMLYAIVATQSRGATLGCGAVLFFLWLQGKKKTLGMIGIAVVAIGVLAVAPSAYFQRMGTISNPIDGSAQGRVNAWKAGLGMGAKNPILGVGAGHFGPRWGKTAHSSYVLAFGELGFPGFICVIALVVGNIRVTMNMRRRVLAVGTTTLTALPGARKSRSRKPPDPGEMRVGNSNDVVAKTLLLFAASMVGFAVAGAFLSATYYPHLYIFGGVMMAARAIAARQCGVPIVDDTRSKVRRRRANSLAAQPAAAAASHSASAVGSASGRAPSVATKAAQSPRRF